MKDKNKICTLDSLKIGQRAEIIKINITKKDIKRHLLDMGITKGVIVEMKKKAPFGDPIDIKLRDYELCLRKNELKKIEVKILK